MPPQDEETHDSSAAEESLPLPLYTDNDLEILHEIIALATTAAAGAEDRQSFRHIWRAYDAVLAARKINPTPDKVYYRFMMEMQAAPGEDLRERFIYMLDKLGVDVENTRYTDLDSVTEEATTEYNRARFERVRERRDRARQSAPPSPMSSEEEEEYHAEDEGDTKDNVGAAQKVGQVEVRPCRRVRSPIDLRDDAVRAATAAAQLKRLEVRERRAGMSKSDSEQHSSASSATHSASDNDDGINIEPRLIGLAVRMYEGVTLRKFFQMWKEKVAEREFFDQRAAEFRRTSLLVRVFGAWRRERWFAAQRRKAERRYDLVLLARAWSVWVQQTAAIVQRSAEMQQRILARKYFNIWRDIILRNRENEEKARLFQLSCVIHRWKLAFNRRRDDEDQAMSLYENKLVARVYWKWYFALLNIDLPRRYDYRLVRGALLEWREKANGVMQLHAMADAFRRRKILQQYFDHWLYRTDKAFEDQDHATDYLQLHQQKTAFDNWRKQATLAPLVKGMQDVVKDRILYQHFNLWRQRTTNEIAAAEMHKQHLVRKAIRNWRLALRHSIMAEHHDRTITRNTMQHWVRQERLQLLLRTHNRKLARGVIQLMAERLKEKKDRLRQSYRQVATLHRRNTARDIFQFWYQKMTFLREREQIVANRYHGALAEKALFIWRERIRVMGQKAADAYYYFRMTQILARWKAATAEAKKARLKEAYQTVARNRKRRTALEFFRRWRAKSDRLWDLNQRANGFSDARLHELGRDILYNWNARLALAMDQQADAEELDYRRLVGPAFNEWRENYRRQQELELRAQIVVQESNLKLLLKYLKRWDTRYSRICWRREDAVREYERNEIAKALSIFRQWREKAYHRQRQNDTSSQFGGGFSDHAAPHPADGVVTPRRGLKTPGWKTIGATTMRRGVLGNRNLMLSTSTPVGSPGSPLKRYGLFGRSTLGRVTEPDEEDDGTLVGSGSGGPTVGSRSVASKGGL
ncbi:Sfi1 spindle body protein-domain-containing protein [Sphaerosporella brunnea]|uniref:Sfi1 spindle body protein-domain-containing protein n=1 Tax=Sphaerosporella brunnea TaxID=1250544 RepID=A0A5J5FB16_9PEZI|nr:Sfi1 spindle body protein-domain-containing protein [Sphaerosporella brunnea]